MTKYVAIVSSLAILGSLMLMIDAQSQLPAARQHTPPTDEPWSIYAQGRIEGATPEIELRPRLQGPVAVIPVEEGQFVEQGELLLQVDEQQRRHEMELFEAKVALADAELRKLLNGARQQRRDQVAAEYEAKQAQLRNAEIAWQRAEGLRSANAIAPQLADDKKERVESLRAEAEAAKAAMDLVHAPPRPDEVEMAEARLAAAKAEHALAIERWKQTRLLAPAAARVLKIHAELGELVGPATAQPAIILADTRRFRVRAFVEELDAPKIRRGMTATITADGLGDRELSGKVVWVSPRMGRKHLWSDAPTERQDTKTREVLIELSEQGDLVVGLRVDVTIDPRTGTVGPSRPPCEGPRTGQPDEAENAAAQTDC